MADKSVSVGQDNKGIINQGEHNTIYATGFLVTSNYIITTYANIAHLDNLIVTFDAGKFFKENEFLIFKSIQGGDPLEFEVASGCYYDHTSKKIKLL